MPVISEGLLKSEGGVPVLIDRGWKFKKGDFPQWADPDYDDSDWINLQSSKVYKDEYDTLNFEGMGWFRLTVQVDSALWGKTIAADIDHPGASEVYLNGKLICTLGHIGEGKKDTQHDRYFLPRPRGWKFDNKPIQVIAVRYANYSAKSINYQGGNMGIRFRLGALWPATLYALSENAIHHGAMMFFLGSTAAISLLHMLLYAFNTRQKGNLYFSLMTLALASLILGLYFLRIGGVHLSFGQSYVWVRLSILLLSIILLRFMFSVVCEKLPKIYWYITAPAFILVLAPLILPRWLFYSYTLFLLIAGISMLAPAIKRKIDGISIIAVGIVLFVAFSAYNVFTDLGIIEKFPGWIPIKDEFMFGVLALILSMSIYLARHVAQTHQRLRDRIDEINNLSRINLEQERRVREEALERQKLQLENERKGKELEEALKRQKLADQLEKTNEELRNAQSQLVQSEKMASLGMLTAGVAHEINTPIGAIYSSQSSMQSAVQKLKEHILQGKKQEECEDEKMKRIFQVCDQTLDVIRSGSERVTEIVRRMKTFARLDEAELQVSDIHRGIEDTLMMVHHKTKHGVEVYKNFGEVPELACFPSQLNQVFLNIIVNAIQAMDNEGELKIKTWADANNAYVSISDNGSGIDPRQVEKIFDPGFTTKGVGVGTGLGLSIVYQIITKHKGKIEVDSILGKGSTFTITIPLDLSLEEISENNNHES